MGEPLLRSVASPEDCPAPSDRATVGTVEAGIEVDVVVELVTVGLEGIVGTTIFCEAVVGVDVKDVLVVTVLPGSGSCTPETAFTILATTF